MLKEQARELLAAKDCGKPSDCLNPKVNWEAFTTAGTMANTVLGFLIVLAVSVCIGMLIAGAMKQRAGDTRGSKSSMSAEEGKSLLISGGIGLIVCALVMKIADAMWLLPGVGS